MWLSRFFMAILVSISFCTSVALAQDEPGVETPPATKHPVMESETIPPYVIAVIEDGPCAYFENILQLVEKELAALVEDEIDVQFKRVPQFNAGWNVSRAAEVLQAALDDPEVDQVFAAGILVAEAATPPDVVLPKPVISGFVQDPDVVGLPYDKDGYSTKKNFTFVVMPLRAERDLEVLRQIVPFEHLAPTVDSVLLDGLESVQQQIDAGAETMGARITTVAMDESADAVLAAVPDDADAVYLTPPLRMGEKEWQKVITGLNARRLPTFSMMGHMDVDAGVLAGLAPETDARLARRLALNMQQIIEGTPPEQLKVPMPVEEKLVINAKTAAQIGYSPSFEVLLGGAELLHSEFLRTGEPLTMEEAVSIALSNNTQLAIKRAEVLATQQDRRLAGSALFPQLEGNLQRAQIDSDRAEASMGTQPEQWTTVGLSATQIIFNDPVLSQFRAAGRLFDAALLEEEGARLDTMEAAAKAYVAFLQAKALLRIEIDNLHLTRNNRDLARIRHKVGTAGPEEVYRWEAQEADQRARVLNAESVMETARIAMNRILGIGIDTPWQPEEIIWDQEQYFFLGGELRPHLKNRREFELFGDYVVSQALQNDLALQALDKSIEAQRISLNQSRRRYVVPEIALSFSLDHTLDEERPGDDALVTSGASTDDDEWLLAVQASLPLFEGGGRHFDIIRNKAVLDQLRETRNLTGELIEQRARTAHLAVGSSFPNMKLQSDAASYAQKNLDVVQDKYARGTVSIVELLDAQNQAFVAKQSATIAVYAFLSDLVELQRAMSWFEYGKSEEETTAWLGGYKALLIEE